MNLRCSLWIRKADFQKSVLIDHHPMSMSHAVAVWRLAAFPSYPVRPAWASSTSYIQITCEDWHRYVWRHALPAKVHIHIRFLETLMKISFHKTNELQGQYPSPNPSVHSLLSWLSSIIRCAGASPPMDIIEHWKTPMLCSAMIRSSGSTRVEPKSLKFVI